MEKVIEVDGLSFGYGEKLLLENVDFSIEKGDFIGIIGPNGSGKSTLVKLLLGILKPMRGEIRILGESIHQIRQWGRVGYISQKANAFNSSFPATVEEVVGANLYSRVGLFKPLGKHHKEQIEHALSLVNMQDFRRSMIGNLSGGQQQRVFIARVLVSSPDIMFLDEPTVGIDAKTEEAVYCLLARLNQELGITIAMVTHDISAITIHANKLACMGEKGLYMHDTSKDFSEEELTRLYGYGVKLHVHKHNCQNCNRKGA
jgi:zinc transport system ATP-binding protein